MAFSSRRLVPSAAGSAQPALERAERNAKELPMHTPKRGNMRNMKIKPPERNALSLGRATHPIRPTRLADGLGLESVPIHARSVWIDCESAPLSLQSWAIANS